MIVFICGTNGSGKTSAVKHLLGDDYHVRKYDGYKITRGNGYVAFGPYYPDKKMGGADCNNMGGSTTDNLKRFIVDFAEEDCLIEGLLLPNMINIRRFREVQGRQVMPIFLHTDLETLLHRLEVRNGVKKVYKNGAKNIDDKNRQVLRVHRYCVEEEQDLPALLIDTTGATVEGTLAQIDAHVAECQAVFDLEAENV